MKGQSGLALLLTYGMMFVVVATAGMVFRESVLGRFHQKTAVGFEKFNVYDFKVCASGSPQPFSMEIGNNFGERMLVQSVDFHSEGRNASVAVNPNLRLSPDEKATVSGVFDPPLVEGNEGTRFEIDVVFHFLPRSGIAHKDGGRLLGRIEMAEAQILEEDNTPPEVSGVEPTDVENGTSVVFWATASDEVGVAGCDFWWDGEEEGKMSGSGNYTFELEMEEVGVFDAWANCSDAEGNYGWEETEVNVTAEEEEDNTPPEVSGVEPTDVENGTSVVFWATASDDVGVEGCDFWWDGEEEGEMSGSGNYTFELEMEEVGVFDAWANCSDAEGNYGWEETEVSVTEEGGEMGGMMISYYDHSPSWGRCTPRYRTYDEGWSEEGWANCVGGKVKVWQRLAVSPSGEKFILGTQDDHNHINLQVWDGEEWGELLEVSTSAPGPHSRAFDVAYEESGDAIVVYRSGDDLPKYRVWNGEGWSVEEETRGETPCVLKWIELEAKPGSDEIVLTTLDSDRRIYAQIWDGEGWGEEKLLTSQAHTSAYKCLDVAWDGSGEAVVVYGERPERAPKYRVWDGESWGEEEEAGTACTSSISWIKLAAEPGSERMLMGVSCASHELNLQVWDGEGWGENYEIDGHIESQQRRCFDVAFVEGKGVVVYGDKNVGTPKYATWDGEWSATGFCSSGPSDPQWVALEPYEGGAFLAVMDDRKDLHVQRWDGEGWGENEKLESDSFHNFECFSLASG